MAHTIKHRYRALVALGAAALAGLALVVSAGTADAQSPHWFVVMRTAPSQLAPGQKGQVVAQIINLGDATVASTEKDPVTIVDALPPGLVATGPMQGFATKGSDEKGNTGNTQESPLTSCTGGVLPQCSFVGTLPPFIGIEDFIPVEATAQLSPETTEENEIRVEGANAPPKVERRALRITSVPAPPPFGLERYELLPEEEDGSLDLRAGSHPFQMTTSIQFNQTLAHSPAKEKVEKPPQEYPSNPGLVRNVVTTLPAGLVADTKAATFPQCTAAEFATERAGHSNLCPAGTAIGAAVVTFKEQVNFQRFTSTSPVFNLVPEEGEPARFGFDFEGVPAILDTSIKTGGGYSAQVTVKNSSQAAELLSTVVTVWGVPGAEAHDNARGWECLAGGKDYMEGIENPPPCPGPKTGTQPPFLIMPTTCEGPLSSSIEVSSWAPGAELLPKGGLPQVGEASKQGQHGCERLPFEPTLSAQPDQHEAATPSGMEIEVNVPQNTTLSASNLAEADIRNTTLRLPEGMQANAGGADGLGVCSVGQAGFSGSDGETGEALKNTLAGQQFLPGPVSCPNAAKVGTVSIKTPLLENELKGNLYFGDQDTNPFASPLVFYLVAEDPVSGVRVKLGGEVILNPATGRPESVFRNAPPLPFETLKLHLTNGARASQSTPAHCTNTETVASFVPSSGQPAVQRSSSFTTTPNADGQPCPSSGPLPFSPSFVAGSSSSQAGGFSPFTLTIARPDGDAAIKTISMTLPAGAAAVLASVTPCPEPQAAAGECGPESEIGHSTALAGLGSDAVSIPGKVYLTGPYNGAPFGLSAVSEAAAGPFDLGKIVVRSSISVDENTAVATINTAASQFFPKRGEGGEQTSFDGLPEIIKGTPSQIKQLNVSVDRPGFEFNPTNCAPQAVSGTISGYEGTSTSVSSPFQATNCAALPFAPKLTASVQGHASKANGTTFAVNVESPGIGQANIHKVDLTIPAKLPSRLTTIQKACLDSVFSSNPAACPEGSVIGEGIVHTPVLRVPLRGPAYLVSHGGAAFPDVEFVLQGEGIKLLLDGKTDIKKGVTYSRFETSPDAPFTKFESIFPAGPHSALTANVPEKEEFSLCKQTLTIPTEMTAQNGAFMSTTTKVKLLGCGAVKNFKVTKAQLLAKALKACKKKSNKAKRQSCEKQARKKYGAKASKKSSKSAKKK